LAIDKWLANKLKKGLPSAYYAVAGLKAVGDDFINAIDNIHSIFSSSSVQYSANKKNKTTLNTLIRVLNKWNLETELLLAACQHAEGYDVLILVDDAQMNHHEYLFFEEGVDYHYRAKHLLNSEVKIIKILEKKLANISGVKVVRFSDLIERTEIENIKLTEMVQEVEQECFWEGAPLHEYARSSTVRHFKTGIIPNSDIARSYYNFSIQNARICAEVIKKSIEKWSPEFVVTTHGFYSTWGPVKYWSQKFNIPFNTHRKGVHGVQGYILGHNKLVAPYDHSDFWNEFKDLKITQEMKEQLEEKLKNRSAGKTGDVGLYRKLNDSGPSQGRRPLPEEFDVVLFPNVPWDDSIQGVNKHFKDPIDWVCQTVEFFVKNKDKKLIVRFHPAQHQYMPNRIPFRQLVRDVCPEADHADNIYFVMPEEKVSSYDLINRSAVTCVYNGQVAMEASFMGKAVILGGNSHYSRKNIFLEAESKEEYFDLMLSPDKLLSFQDKNRDAFLQYCAMHFLLSEVHFDFLDKEDWYNLDWGTLKGVFEESKNEVVQNIVSCLAGEKSSYQWSLEQLGEE